MRRRRAGRNVLDTHHGRVPVQIARPREPRWQRQGPGELNYAFCGVVAAWLDGLRVFRVSLGTVCWGKIGWRVVNVFELRVEDLKRTPCEGENSTLLKQVSCEKKKEPGQNTLKPRLSRMLG